MPSFIPHSPEETRQMLDDIGVHDIEELFSLVPSELRLGRPLNLPEGISEFDVLEAFESFGEGNLFQGRPLISFAGGGAYDHDLPAAARAVGSRSEFVTAYTPYQPEVSQGILEALFEFQTMISRITGLEITNASIYDGATSLVEAVNLAVAVRKRARVYLSAGVNPAYAETVHTFARGTGHEIVTLELSRDLTTLYEGEEEAAAVVVGYPNFFGTIEDLRQARSFADRTGALLVVVYDPISLAHLSTPGEMGADIAVGEGQCLGTPLSFGGPYLGLFSTRSEFLRHVPGRLVGETVDHNGRTAYVTTLRTREQDIRREKASSNICSNQTLIAINAAIYLAWLGKEGFVELAASCFSSSRYLAEQLATIANVTVVNHHFFREFAVRLPLPADEAVELLAEEGFLAGVPSGPSFVGTYGEDVLVMTATERRTKAEIDRFVAACREVVGDE